MNRELTAEDVRASLVPKSDQLNADDLIAGPVTTTIVGVRMGDKERPIFLDMEGYDKRPYKPCTMMRRLLVAVFGDEPKPWIGRRLTLYRDPQVQYKGDTVGGIRISHVSGITQPQSVLLTEKRGRRVEWVVYPVEATTGTGDQTLIAEATAQINAADTVDALKKCGAALKSKPKAVQDAVRPIYAARLEGLKSQNNPALEQWLTGLRACETPGAVDEFTAMIGDCPAEIRGQVADEALKHKKSLEEANG